MSDDDNEEITNPLAIAESLRQSLKTTDIVEHRETLINEIKDVFVASRMETATLQEQLRAAAIVNLLEKVQTNQMSTAQLMRVIEMTSQAGSGDLASITGGGGKGGINIINNPGQANIGVPGGGVPQVENKGNPIQDAGHILEAVSTIVKQLAKPEMQEEAKNIIDVEATVIKDDDDKSK